MTKRDQKTKVGRVPNAGRNLHEQTTKVLHRPSAETIRLDASAKTRRKRASHAEVADALVEFRASDAAKKWKASAATTKQTKKHE